MRRRCGCRLLAAGVLGLDSGRKHDFKRGSQEWRARVDKTPFGKLAPATVLAWTNACLKAARTPERRNTAAVTLNSVLRNSKALLSKKVLPFIKAEVIWKASRCWMSCAGMPPPDSRPLISMPACC